MNHKEASSTINNAQVNLQEIVRVVSLTPDENISFEVRPIDLIDIAFAKGAKGIIFRAQPGAGKSHIIDKISTALSQRTEQNVYVHIARWSDSMRQVIGNKKPKPGGLSDEKKGQITKHFYKNILLSLHDIARRKRRKFRTHPRAVFTLAELPDGVIDDEIVKDCVTKGFLLVDIIPDPIFQRKALVERTGVWELPKGAVFSDPPEVIGNLRRSAPPEIMASSIEKSDKESRKRLPSENFNWGNMQGIPVPHAIYRQPEDLYLLAARAYTRISRGSTVVYNPYIPARARHHAA